MDDLNFIKEIFSSECFLRTHWGIYCPGCGGTRALVALMQGKIIQSIKYNPITILFLIDFFTMSTLKEIERRNGKYYTAKFRKIINICFLIFIFAFFIFRNFLLYGLDIDMLGDFS